MSREGDQEDLRRDAIEDRRGRTGCGGRGYIAVKGEAMAADPCGCPACTPAEEGDRCRERGCTGHLAFAPSENCTCHISPPCGSCVEAPLVCDVCGEYP